MSNNSPNTPNIIQQGHAAAWSGAWEEAAGFYRQAYENNPDHPRAACLLAHSLLEMGDLENSRYYYEIAARLSPDDPFPIEKIGLIYEQQGKVAESIQFYEKSAELFLKKENNLRAAGCLQHILKQNPDHADARHKLTSIRHSTNLDLSELSKRVDEQPAQTRSELTQAAKKPQKPLDQAHETALAGLASLFFELASSSKTKQTVPETETGIPKTSFRDLSEDPECLNLLNHLNRAADFLARGMNDWGEIELLALLQAGVNDPAILFLLGTLLSESDPPQALSHLKQTRAYPDYALASFLLIGKIYYAQANYPEAATAYLQALAVADSSTSSPDHQNKQPGAYKPWIQSYSRETDSTFQKNLCETIEQEINRSDWLDHLAALHSQIAMPQYKDDTLLAELLAAGGSPLVQRFAGVKELEEDDHLRSAMEEIFYMIEDGPVLLPAQLLIGENLDKQGHTGEAVQKFKLVAKLYALRGQTDQAVLALEQAVLLSPLDIPTRTRLIELLKKQSKIDQAVVHLRKLAEIHYQLAEPEKAHGKLTDAIRLTLTSPSNRALSIELFHQKADLYMQDLQFQKACQIYEQILSLDPVNLTASVRVAALNYRLGNRETAKQKMNGFLHFLIENQKTDQIESYLKSLSEELPEILEIHKQLADWYHKHGNKAQTIEQLNMIAEQLMKKGKNEAAVIVLKTIVSLNPVDAARYQQIIDQIGQLNE